jgi:hypothetical protein
MSRRTLYNIEIDEKLLWDRKIDTEETQSRSFFKWYLARVLNYGNMENIRKIPLRIIRQYFHSLNLSRETQKFWARYLKIG